MFGINLKAVFSCLVSYSLLKILFYYAVLGLFDIPCFTIEKPAINYIIFSISVEYSVFLWVLNSSDINLGFEIKWL